MQKQTRAKLHAAILIVFGVLAVVLDLELDFFRMLPEETDKLTHYRVGRWIAAGCFLVCHLTIVCRILLTGEESLTRKFLWLPVKLLCGAAVAAVLVMALAFGKELLDTGGGKFDMRDIEMTVLGAWTLVPVVGLVMALTPFMIPFDLMLQMSDLKSGRTATTGVGLIDRFLRMKQQAEVAKTEGYTALVLEDDMLCATVMMEALDMLGFKCCHAEGIGAAREYFMRSSPTLKLLIIDNFIRVEAGEKVMTGVEWISELSRTYPREERPFRVLVVTGHAASLGPGREHADRVLPKPWDFRCLREILEEWKLV